MISGDACDDFCPSSRRKEKKGDIVSFGSAERKVVDLIWSKGFLLPLMDSTGRATGHYLSAYMYGLVKDESLEESPEFEPPSIADGAGEEDELDVYGRSRRQFPSKNGRGGGRGGAGGGGRIRGRGRGAGPAQIRGGRGRGGGSGGREGLGLVVNTGAGRSKIKTRKRAAVQKQ